MLVDNGLKCQQPADRQRVRGLESTECGERNVGYLNPLLYVASN